MLIIIHFFKWLLKGSYWKGMMIIIKSKTYHHTGLKVDTSHRHFDLPQPLSIEQTTFSLSPSPSIFLSISSDFLYNLVIYCFLPHCLC